VHAAHVQCLISVLIQRLFNALLTTYEVELMTVTSITIKEKAIALTELSRKTLHNLA
jgi:hypothetical protein